MLEKFHAFSPLLASIFRITIAFALCMWLRRFIQVIRMCKSLKWKDILIAGKRESVNRETEKERLGKFNLNGCQANITDRDAMREKWIEEGQMRSMKEMSKWSKLTEIKQKFCLQKWMIETCANVKLKIKRNQWKDQRISTGNDFHGKSTAKSGYVQSYALHCFLLWIFFRKWKTKNNMMQSVSLRRVFYFQNHVCHSEEKVW